MGRSTRRSVHSGVDMMGPPAIKRKAKKPVALNPYDVAVMKVKGPVAVREATLDRIVRMQGEGPKSRYAGALREITKGKKTGHWIWYIWPCLHHLRPGTSRPEFLLSDLEAARLYLKHSVLRNRLLEITAVAVGHLERGVNPRALFGSSTDAEKFHETMSFFFVAGHEENDEEVVAACNAGLVAFGAK